MLRICDVAPALSISYKEFRVESPCDDTRRDDFIGAVYVALRWDFDKSSAATRSIAASRTFRVGYETSVCQRREKLSLEVFNVLQVGLTEVILATVIECRLSLCLRDSAPDCVCIVGGEEVRVGFRVSETSNICALAITEGSDER